MAGLNDLTNKQQDGYGFQTSFKLQKQGRPFDIVIEPFFRWWKVEDSEIAYLTCQGVLIGYGWEPKNYTKETGVRVSLVF